VDQRGRAVLAMDCALAGTEWQHGRPFNRIVSRATERPSEILMRTAREGGR